MSTLIKLRRSAVPGRVPTTGQLEFGEIAINTADGKFFIKKFDSVANTEVIVEFSADPNDLLALIKTVDGAGSGLDADLLDGLDSTQFLRSDEDDTFDGNLVITGDLTVSGNTTYVNTETIQLADNIIVLNANHTGAPTQNAGLEVERGTSNNVILQWNEANDYWEIASGGTTGRILTVNDEGAGNGLDADTLDGQQGTYYLDYNNFFNVPPATLDLTLDGKVTGTAFSNTGVMTLTTELANTGVVPGTYGTPSQIPVITIDEDGRITSAGNTAVAGVNDYFYVSANNTFTIQTGDGSIFNAKVTAFDENVDFGAGIDVTGNITVTGLVDGRDVAADGAKLDLLEDGLDLTLTGKVTGTASSNTGVMTLVTELANTGVTPGTYGSSSQIPIITVDEDGRLTLVSNTAVAGVDNVTWYTANSTLSILTGDGSVFKANIDEFDEITVNGNIIVNGLVDGRDIAADGAKLDTLEDGLDLTLAGKVTGRAISNTGVMTLTTELANTGVTPGTYGASSFIPVITVDEDGRISSLTTQPSAAGSTVTALDWEVANNTLQLYLSDGTKFNQVIDDFTNLDADTLNGQTAQDILNTAGNTATNSIGDGLVQILVGNGLTGGGSFNLNDFSDTVINIGHVDRTNVADQNNANGVVIQSLEFDGLGHVINAHSFDLDDRYYTELELDAGQLDNRYYTETELNNGQLDSRYYTETELDNGQLDNRYYTETELDNGQLDNRYYTETELNNGQLDNRYYTETESDTRFVNVTGDTMTGDLTISANLDVTGTITAGIIDRNPNITVALTGDIAGSANTTLTNLGDGTITIATTVQADSVALGTDTTGDYVESISNTDGIIIIGAGTGEGSTPTIGHADTSNIANVNTAFKDVISSMDFDQFGHVTALTTRTMDFLTVQEADARYVNVTGDTMSGNLDIQATLTVQDDILQTHAHYVTESVTKSSQNAATLFEFPFATYNSAEVIITATEGINRHITKLLIVHNDTTASATEFGSITTSSNLASYDVSIIGANVRITVTPAQSASTVFKIAATLIVD